MNHTEFAQQLGPEGLARFMRQQHEASCRGRRSKRWNPWQYAGNYFPHLTICNTENLPGLGGATDCVSTIWVLESRPPRLQPASWRRFHLTHELVHNWRGMPTRDPGARAVEEAIVDRIAAELTITIPELADACRNADSWIDMCEMLATPRGVRARLKHLSEADRELIGPVPGRSR